MQVVRAIESSIDVKIEHYHKDDFYKIFPFFKLEFPEWTGEQRRNYLEIVTEKLSGSSGVLLAKNQFGSPVLLIEIRDVENLADIKLENLMVLFNKNCQVQIDEERTKSIFTIINLESENKNLKNHFLRLISSLIEYLGNSPNQKTLQKEIINFIELFKAISEPPKKTIQGLWRSALISLALD